MSYYNGSGGYLKAVSTITSIEEYSYRIPIIDWEFEATPVLQVKTGADSDGVVEYSAGEVNIEGSLNVQWDSDAPPESTGLKQGTITAALLYLGKSGFYYYFNIITSRLRPRVSTRDGSITYALSFRGNGPQPDPRDPQDLWTIEQGNVLQAQAPSVQRPRTSVGGIEYRILHEGGGGYLESFNQDGYTASYVCLVDWDDANAWVVDMLGSHFAIGGNIIRNNPEPHLYFPQLYCVHLELLRNYGPPAMDLAVQGMIQYNEVAYRATFQSLPYNVLSDTDALVVSYGEVARYVSMKDQPGIEAITRPGYAYQYNEFGITGVVPTPPALLIPGHTLTLTAHLWPQCNTAVLDPALGMLNKDAFTLPIRDGTKRTFVAQTMLFQGYEPEYLPATTGGNTLWRIIFHFACKTGVDRYGTPLTWNRTYHPTKNRYVGVVEQQTGLSPYQEVDFKTLFAVT